MNSFTVCQSTRKVCCNHKQGTI